MASSRAGSPLQTDVSRDQACAVCVDAASEGCFCWINKDVGYLAELGRGTLCRSLMGTQLFFRR